MKKLFLYFCIINVLVVTIKPYYFYAPLHDPMLFPSTNQDDVALFLVGAGGIKNAYAYTNRSHTTTALNIWDNNQNSIAMLNGFDSNTPIGQLAQTVNATDDGIRGHMALTGNFKIDYAFLYGLHIPFADDWSLLFLLPHYHANLRDVLVEDLTQANSAEDIRVKKMLTSQINTLLNTYGAGLSTDTWSKAGLGDLSCYIQWNHYFPQQKPFLKEVGVQIKSGIILPTAKKESLLYIMSSSFGNDGCWAIPFGTQLTLQLGNNFIVGIDVELTHIFDKSGHYRIKTDYNQTELFLLKVAKAHKDFGMNQRFELFCKAFHPKGLEFRLAYQYFKHGDDELTPCSTMVNSNLANSASLLHETTAHHVIAAAEWNLARTVDKGWAIEPVVSLFAKIPFNGSNALLTPLVGGSFNIYF